MSDAEQIYERVLVLRCRAGDRAAFAELIASYQARLRYYVRQLVRNPDKTEDILQEVWLDVFRGLPHLDHVAAFPAWIYQIARCRALREGRKHTIPQVSLHLETDRIEDQQNETNLAMENAECIHVALLELAEEHREILMLRFLEEMSYEDIAKVMGCPLGTVASRIYHAKRALRSALERKTCHE
jgi:RNA polymerase sigma-70 factor (ECF subfamily)